MQELMAE
jgi:hypothetical protein